MFGCETLSQLPLVSVVPWRDLPEHPEPVQSPKPGCLDSALGRASETMTVALSSAFRFNQMVQACPHGKSMSDAVVIELVSLGPSFTNTCTTK